MVTGGKDPLVSICCTTYNHETYIRDAIEGFLMQTTTFQVEIIIHDDASTDHTSAIVKAYADRYPDLIRPVFQKENQYSKGIKPAAKFSWPLARGKYIALCEGDDYWTDPYKLEKQVQVMEANPHCSFCYHNAEIFNCKTGDSESFNHALKDGFLTTKALVFKWSVPTASVLIRKKMIPDPIPDWFHQVISADLALALLLTKQGPCYYLKEKMSVYRVFAINSLSLTGPDRKIWINQEIFLLNSYRKDEKRANTLFVITYTIWKLRLFLFYLQVIRYFPFIKKWITLVKSRFRK